MRCRGTGRLIVVKSFMDRLESLRVAYNRPLIITSGYRDPEYDKLIGGKGPHRTGRAVDTPVYGDRAWELMGLAIQHGFTGIGVRQHGPYNSRFIHLDDLAGELRPRIWSYR
jgi:uncharacterized protein YcbK (DUF882 family)